MTTINCGQCHGAQEVDPTASTFTCANCGKLMRFMSCTPCGWVGQVADDFAVWVCPKCSRKHPRTWRTAHVSFANAHYVGGYAALGRSRMGNFHVTAEAVGIGTLNPKVAVLHMKDVASIEVTGGEVSKRKTGAVLAFGVLGLAARGSKQQTAVVVRTKSGESAYYQIDKQQAINVRAKIAPVLKEAGVPFFGESPATPSTPVANQPPLASVADELRKLAQLRDDGVLTSDEFDAQKARLLG